MEKGERGQARVENLEELVGACRNFEAEDRDQPELPQFLDQVALDAGDRQADQDEDAVPVDDLTQRQRPGVSAGVYCWHGGKFIPPQNVFR